MKEKEKARVLQFTIPFESTHLIPNCAKLGSKPLTHELLGDTQYLALDCNSPYTLCFLLFNFCTVVMFMAHYRMNNCTSLGKKFLENGASKISWFVWEDYTVTCFQHPVSSWKYVLNCLSCFSIISSMLLFQFLPIF